MRSFKNIFTFFALALFTILYSCNNKPPIKEVVYKIDSIGQFKNYLKGHWYRPINKDAEKYFYSFDFRSNSFGVFQDFKETEIGKYTMITCAPTFKITQNQQGFYIEFISMFLKRDTSSKYKIVRISNKQIILKNKTGPLIYTKKEE